MNAAKIILIAFWVAEAFAQAAMHGKPRPAGTYNIWGHLIVMTIYLTMLYLAGFFN